MGLSTATPPPPTQPTTLPPTLGSLADGLYVACDLLDQLRGAIEDAVKLVILKWTHLRRLVDILSNIGFTLPLPDLSFLPNILTLDLRLYAALQAACPELKLPAYSNQAIEELRSKVLTAYAALARGLSFHPWSMLTGLQEAYDALTKEVDKLIASAGFSGGIFGCIQGICDGTLSHNIASVFEGISMPDGFVKNYGKLLTAQQLALKSQVNMAHNELKLLSGMSVQ